jgi:hypothetical protein
MPQMSAIPAEQRVEAWTDNGAVEPSARAGEEPYFAFVFSYHGDRLTIGAGRRSA